MAEIITMPKLGFDMAEGTLVRWVVSEGNPVTKGAVLAEIETDKATVEVESTQEGVLLRHLVPQGTIVPVNEPIAVVGKAGEEVDLEALLGQTQVAEKQVELEKPVEQAAPAAVQELTPVTSYPQVVSETPHASPLARSMAVRLGIDLRLVRGSGPGGRITKKDIEAYGQREPEVTAPGVTRPVPIAPASVNITARESKTVPIPKLRSAIGRRMTESMQQAPHFYVTHEYDVARLLTLRKDVNALLGEEDKLSVNDFIVKGVALTLLEYPNLNASIDLKSMSLIYHGEINVGVAVAVENGLLTVVSRNTEQKSVFQISAELKTMVKRAREGKVRPDDIEGSTFTVSNLGMYEVDQFTAIINPPEAAILAIGSAREVPVVVDGEVKAGSRMKATISVDHRISDGAEGAKFLQSLVKYIEEPMRLLIEVVK